MVTLVIYLRQKGGGEKGRWNAGVAPQKKESQRRDTTKEKKDGYYMGETTVVERVLTGGVET